MTAAVRVARYERQTVSYRLIGSGARKVLFFHGFPGSSAQVSLFDSYLVRTDLTVLCLDRPGYGQSTATSGLDQIALGIQHCRAVLAELNWSSFEVFAVSGGTPLALALSHSMGHRVVRTTISCGLGPLGDHRARALMPRLSLAGLTLLPRVPSRILSRVMASSGSNPDKQLMVLNLFFNASRPDQEVLKDSEVRKALAFAKSEAFAQAGVGPQADARSYLLPWSWDYSQFSSTDVRFFHGLEDRVIPPAMAEFMASVIPGARLERIEGEGHFSLPVRKLARMLEV